MGLKKKEVKPVFKGERFVQQAYAKPLDPDSMGDAVIDKELVEACERAIRLGRMQRAEFDRWPKKGQRTLYIIPAGGLA